jgi:hypothetical protein
MRSVKDSYATRHAGGKPTQQAAASDASSAQTAPNRN